MRSLQMLHNELASPERSSSRSEHPRELNPSALPQMSAFFSPPPMMCTRRATMKKHQRYAVQSFFPLVSGGDPLKEPCPPALDSAEIALVHMTDIGGALLRLAEMFVGRALVPEPFDHYGPDRKIGNEARHSLVQLRAAFGRLSFQPLGRISRKVRCCLPDPLRRVAGHEFALPVLRWIELTQIVEPAIVEVLAKQEVVLDSFGIVGQIVIARCALTTDSLISSGPLLPLRSRVRNWPSARSYCP